MKPIIDPTASLTFSDYYKLQATDDEIADYFGYRLQRISMSLAVDLSTWFSDEQSFFIKEASTEIEQQIRAVLPYVNLDTEAARREILIAPLVLKLLQIVKPQLKFEYPLFATNQLKGAVDYYFKSQSSQILIVEAKAADTDRGFKQLVAELVAFQIREEWTQLIYGAVTTGQTWHFGRLNPTAKILERDIDFYTEPQGIEELLSILAGILTTPAHLSISERNLVE